MTGRQDGHGPGSMRNAVDGVTEREYDMETPRLFRVVLEQLATGATFTLEGKDPGAGVITFHSYDGARFTLTLSSHGPGTTVRLDAVGDAGGRRAAEFLGDLDGRVRACAAPSRPHARNGKKTSKLAVFGIIVGLLYVLLNVIGVDGWSLLFALTIPPALLAGFAVYATRRGGKVQGRVLAWVAVGITLVGLLAGTVSNATAALREAGRDDVSCGTIAWPDSGIGAKLPAPDRLSGSVVLDSSDEFTVALCDAGEERFDAYTETLKDAGFSVDYYKSDGEFSARDGAGNDVSVSYEDGVMTIDIVASPSDDAPSDDVASDGSGTADSGASGDGLAGGGQSVPDDDFKEAMDGYEAFIDKYVDFMNAYDEGGQSADMLADYADMMSQYSETMSKIDAIDEGTLTPDQDRYYIEVMGRINQKLLSIG